ncbi:(2Fe-2S) ferredoxin domain-containing protein [Mycolicibacterium komossense]|uniref:(2Fe-2S) ferredoxin domain-containing protein n=2 Tax=Mycobacteriaceae TaxID=1762 RepID=A0A1Y5PNU2_9MYCO|nr:(2Fe-2S) ferredoxin domain-containing protein [Mycolicibacterium komossense]MCV7226472.1 (2Fe-2S) ferredoxin domain-containing protein [Mycolicibacterium komossense]SBS79050.1 conserved hypothetical protein [uncultured Mycobacterium sp.]
MALDQSKPTVTVCRGCCCGTVKKHPTIDHDARLANLRNRVEGIGNLRVSDCLGPCERSNVVVVSPSKRGHRVGGRPVWLGYVLDAAAEAGIATWLLDGGPGLAPPPKALASFIFRPASK